MLTNGDLMAAIRKLPADCLFCAFVSSFLLSTTNGYFYSATSSGTRGKLAEREFILI